MQRKRIEELQLQFIRRVMGREPDPSEVEAVKCNVAQTALFDLADALQRAFPPRDEANAKPVAEAALTEAIGSMAEHGAMEAFQGMRPRLRRAVRVRIRTLLTIVTANEAAGKDRISVLPRGFPADQVGLALLATMGVELPPSLRAKLE
jgi:hypothetical protein